MANSKTHYYWLDLIRFLAAFIVVASHFRGAFFVDYSTLPIEQRTPLIFAFYAITRLGAEAVLIFFVLSGFLVGGKAIERMQANTFDIKSYTLDRTVRIMLPLLSALLLYLPVTIIRGGAIDWQGWLGSLFSLQGVWTTAVIEPLWSLSYEVWFYALMGAFAIFIMKGSAYKQKVVSAIILAAIILIFMRLSTHYLFLWLFGAFSFLVIPHKPNRILLYISVFLMLAFLIPLQLTSGSNLAEWGNFGSYFPNRQALELIFSISFCLFLQQIVLLKPQHKLALIINRFGTKFAAFSYTLYLTHYLILRMFEYWGVPKSASINMLSITWYIGELLLALLVAYAVYWCFEKRTTVVKAWLRTQLGWYIN